MERWVISTGRSGSMAANEAVATPAAALAKGALTAPRPAASPHVLFPGRHWEESAGEILDFYRYRTDPFGGVPELFRGNDYY